MKLFNVYYEGEVVVFAEDEAEAERVFLNNRGQIVLNEPIDVMAKEITSRTELNTEWLNCYPYSDMDDSGNCQKILSLLEEKWEKEKQEKLKKEYDEKHQLKLPL